MKVKKTGLQEVGEMNREVDSKDRVVYIEMNDL